MGSRFHQLFSRMIPPNYPDSRNPCVLCHFHIKGRIPDHYCVGWHSSNVFHCFNKHFRVWFAMRTIRCLKSVKPFKYIVSA